MKKIILNTDKKKAIYREFTIDLGELIESGDRYLMLQSDVTGHRVNTQLLSSIEYSDRVSYMFAISYSKRLGKEFKIKELFVLDVKTPQNN
jgi:hypothetical protein